VKFLSLLIVTGKSWILMKNNQLKIWQLMIIIAALIGILLGGISILRQVMEDFPSKPTQSPPLLQSMKQTAVADTPIPTVTSTVVPTRTPAPTATLRPTLTPSPTPIIVITGIHALGRLETAQYTLRDIVEMKDAPDNILERFSQDKLLLIAEGEVVAGFDLAMIEEGDIVVIYDTVLLILPEPEILYTRIDNDRTYVYERETGLFRRPDPDLETAARRLAERQIRDWAVERGILEDAEEFGLLYLENFLYTLGFNKVRIEIRQ
jgi:hypothetical protein